MEDLIIFVDNKPIISNEFKENYKKFITLKEQIEEAQEILKSEMLTYFESLNEEDRKTLDFDEFKISYTKANVRHTFDSKKFQDEHPKMYREYVRETKVDATIKFMKKGEKNEKER